eukprot:jgi/Botrbrau1/2251/Bobra.101_2s0076.1
MRGGLVNILLAHFLGVFLGRCMARVLSPASAPVSLLAPSEDPDAELGHKDSIYYRLDPNVYKSLTGTGNPSKMTAFPDDNYTMVLSNLPMTKKTVQEVNQAAPVDNIPTDKGPVKAKPFLTQYSQFGNGEVAKNGYVHSMSVDEKTGRKIPDKIQGNAVNPAALEEHPARPGAVSAKANSFPIIGANGQPGFFLNTLVGVRVATPFFGSGFNFCVDRFWSSFPKVGIVIPNPVAWLLPEFVSMASEFQTTIRLPIGGKTAPPGTSISRTSDGFVIWLPSPFQPTSLPQFGFRYGLQVAQAFGVDFGFGWSQVTCSVDFIRV